MARVVGVLEDEELAAQQVELQDGLVQRHGLGLERRALDHPVAGALGVLEMSMTSWRTSTGVQSLAMSVALWLRSLLLVLLELPLDLVGRGVDGGVHVLRLGRAAERGSARPSR